MNKAQAVPEMFPSTNTDSTIMAQSSPAQMMVHAMGNGATLESIGKMLELQERWEATQAKKAYNKAMAAFKANPPEIEKDKKVAFGATKYNHATLANVTRKINAALSLHGLSAAWSTNQTGVAISVTCKITHEQGHSEETTLTAQADTSGSKNAIQSIGSTITYLERYTLLALTGLATHESEDDDGKAAGVELISEEDVTAIMDHLTDLGTPIEKFLTYMKIEKLESMPKSDLPKAKLAIENARKKKASK